MKYERVVVNPNRRKIYLNFNVGCQQTGKSNQSMLGSYQKYRKI